MKIAIYGSRHQDDYVDDIIGLVRTIVERGDSIVMHEKLYRYLSEVAPERFLDAMEGEEVTSSGDFTADLTLSIGGDGTFLRTSGWVADKEIPIIGVNTGHLGFLAPFTVAEAIAAIENDCLSTYKIESRSLLHVETPYSRLDTWPYALNEVALLKRDTASMISVDATIDHAPLADYLCDGLIISTPTGSTGYNLSVGGPIVQPGSPSFVISPIAAHSLSMRPLVIDDGGLLELKVYSRTSGYRISIDGRSVNMPCGSPIFVSRAPFVIRTVQKPGHNFFATLREKLLWGATMQASKYRG